MSSFNSSSRYGVKSSISPLSAKSNMVAGRWYITSGSVCEDAMICIVFSASAHPRSCISILIFGCSSSNDAIIGSKISRRTSGVPVLINVSVTISPPFCTSVLVSVSASDSVSALVPASSFPSSLELHPAINPNVIHKQSINPTIFFQFFIRFSSFK